MTTACILIYITTRDQPEAERLGRMLVEKELAAGVNIIPGVQSIYRWQGKIESNGEAILIVKTLAALFSRAASAVREMHSYECPCIVALPITAGTPDFLAWIGRAGATAPPEP